MKRGWEFVAVRARSWTTGLVGLSIVIAGGAAAVTPATASVPSGDVQRNVVCTISGTPGDDRLIGTAGSDVICGFGGDDRIDGRGGDDILIGGRGDDAIQGGTGRDRIVGGTGNDSIAGGPGRDVVRAGRGNDRIDGDDADEVDDGPGRDLDVDRPNGDSTVTIRVQYNFAPGTTVKLDHDPTANNCVTDTPSWTDTVKAKGESQFKQMFRIPTYAPWDGCFWESNRASWNITATSAGGATTTSNIRVWFRVLRIPSERVDVECHFEKGMSCGVTRQGDGTELLTLS